VYGFETGIARDAELNALGGIRFPDVEVGRALFIASLLDFEILPGLPGLVGAWFDLQCVPVADGSSRFASHGDYVRRVVRQTNALHRSGFLLGADAETLKQQAAESEVGKPDTCAQ
jgi:alpha/beta hydrolase family protein